MTAEAAPPLLVSTRCPSCGAPLEFGEGTNAIRCGHCQSNLLVTGRGRVLTYLVAARLSGAEAQSLARFPAAGGAGNTAGARRRRSGEPRLLFLPFFRLTATELRWQRGEPERPAAGRLEDARRRSTLAALLDPRPDAAFDWRMTPNAVGRLAGGVHAAGRSDVDAGRRPGPVEFRGRRIERNLLACDALNFAVASLGVRPSVLSLELFRRNAIPPEARVVAPSLAADSALETALVATDDEGLIGRAVVSRLLSLVYFPFWAVAASGGGCLTVLDAVSGAVVRRDGDPEALDRLAPLAPGRNPATLGFRSLACPNCGWDLPVEPEGVVFHCGACERAWLLEGEQMIATPADVAAAPPGCAASRCEWLPMWVVPCGGEARAGRSAEPPRRFLVPAFLRRNLKVLKDIALRLTQANPHLEPHESERPPLGGCVLDPADAASLARFLAAGVTRAGRPLLPGVDAEYIAPAAARLVWLPFAREAYGLREPITGTALPPELAA